MKSADRRDTVLIVDFGSQVTQLIARRIREAGIHSEIAPFQSAEAAFRRTSPKAVILSGGPASTTETGSPRCEPVSVTYSRCLTSWSTRSKRSATVKARAGSPTRNTQGRSSEARSPRW